MQRGGLRCSPPAKPAVLVFCKMFGFSRRTLSAFAWYAFLLFIHIAFCDKSTLGFFYLCAFIRRGSTFKHSSNRLDERMDRAVLPSKVDFSNHQCPVSINILRRRGRFNFNRYAPPYRTMPLTKYGDVMCARRVEVTGTGTTRGRQWYIGRIILQQE